MPFSMPPSRPTPARSCSPAAAFRLARLLLLAAALLLPAACGGKAPKKKPDVPVVTAAAVLGPARLTLDAVGQVEASQSVDIKSRVDGHIIKIHFLDGAEVQAGDLLFTIDPGTLAASHDEATAELSAQREKAARAAQELARYERLVDQGFISRDEYELKRADAAVAMDSLKARLAGQAQAGRQLGYTTITAPFSGKIGSANFDIGSLVQENEDVLVTLKRISPAEVSFSLPERELIRVREAADSGRLTVLAAPMDDGEHPAQGDLTFYDNWVNPKTGMFALKASFDNADTRLWPGQYVTATLVLRTVPEAVHIPAVALMRGAEGEFVWVVAEGKAQVRPVTCLLRRGEEAVVAEGLKPGELVVVDGQMKLTPGATVSRKTPEGKEISQDAPGKGQDAAPAPDKTPAPPPATAAPAPAGAAQ